jgi:hypothetical protein
MITRSSKFHDLCGIGCTPPPSLSLSLPPSHPQKWQLLYCQPSCVVLSLWQTTSMSYAMSQLLLRPLSKSSNKWNPHPIMRVLCVNDSHFFFAQTFQGLKSTLNFVERAAWWLFTYAPLMIVVVNVNGNGTAQPSIYLVVILE